jgi:hypothetical protein
MNLTAPTFGLLMSHTPCHACQAMTRVACLWVPTYTEIDEPGDDPEHYPDPALLSFVEQASPKLLEQVQAHAPWMRMDYTRTSGLVYLANHCEQCQAVQGDHYLGKPGGPFWPDTPELMQALRFEPCEGPLEAQASAGSSSWMEQVPALPRARGP